MSLGLTFRDQLPDGVRDEFEHFASKQNGLWDGQHNADGSHTALTCDSLATQDTARNLLPITGSLQLLKGGLYIDAEGSASHVAGLRPPQWTANQNDYNPPGLRDAMVVEVESDAARDLTGIAVAGRRKRLLVFGNRGNHTITLRNASASSMAIHRFGFEGGTDEAVGSGGYRWLWYDVGSNLWRLVR